MEGCGSNDTKVEHVRYTHGHNKLSGWPGISFGLGLHNFVSAQVKVRRVWLHTRKL